jgi:hypothetical protein
VKDKANAGKVDRKREGMLEEAKAADVHKKVARWHARSPFGRREGRDTLEMEAEYAIRFATEEFDPAIKDDWIGFATRSASTHVRNLGRGCETELSTVYLEDLPEASDGDEGWGLETPLSPLWEIEREEAREALDRVNTRLKGREKKVFKLRREGKTFNEIAGCVRVSLPKLRAIWRSIEAVAVDELGPGWPNG